MRVLILMLIPLAATALPPHEATHYYRLEECGTVQMVLVIPPDEPPTLAGYGLSDRQSEKLLDQRREAVEHGYAARVEMNPDCAEP